MTIIVGHSHTHDRGCFAVQYAAHLRNKMSIREQALSLAIGSAHNNPSMTDDELMQRAGVFEQYLTAPQLDFEVATMQLLAAVSDLIESGGIFKEPGGAEHVRVPIDLWTQVVEMNQNRIEVHDG